MSDFKDKKPSLQNDLEIKDARVIFETAWDELETEVGRDKMRFPKAMILLGGAPGSGKGTQTDFILKNRGFSGEPIVVSSLLNTPEMKRIKDSGRMVGDRDVIGLLLRELIKSEYRDGAILDGFPRTEVQVDCLKRLVHRINQLHQEHKDTPRALDFRRPVIHVMVLYVEEAESVERQLKRGKEIESHNEKVKSTGDGELQELRITDLDVSAARGRYQVFKEQTWKALQSLHKIYHYHFINARGTIEEVENLILNELKYQSSLELDPKTYDYIRMIPVASEIVQNARTELVNRLDNYVQDDATLFHQIVTIVEKQFMPIIIRHAITGRSVVSSEENVFDNPLAIAMLIDIFSERGYDAVVDKRVHEIADRVDLKTGVLHRSQKNVYRVLIHFKGSQIRRG